MAFPDNYIFSNNFTFKFGRHFRYPYYMLHIYKVNIRLVTWVRYTAWIPLYPLGFLFEGQFELFLEEKETLSCLILFGIYPYSNHHIQEHTSLGNQRKAVYLYA